MSATTEQKTTEEAQVDIEKVVDDLKERVRSSQPRRPTEKISCIACGAGSGSGGLSRSLIGALGWGASCLAAT